MYKKKYRKNIPKAVKDRLWDITFGPEAGQGKCYVCEGKINSKRFEAGHIVSVFNGGKDTIDNLKCICSTCNKSMGIHDLNLFKKIYFPGKYKRKQENCTCHCKKDKPLIPSKEICEEPLEYKLIPHRHNPQIELDEEKDEKLLKKIKNLDKFYFDTSSSD